MDVIAGPEVKRLSEVDGRWCVSIFMPAHRAGAETQQDRIRLKNLLREAERQLVEAGLRTPDAAAIPEPGQALLAESDFWQHQSDGLAVFAHWRRVSSLSRAAAFPGAGDRGEAFPAQAALPPAEIKTCWTGRRSTPICAAARSTQ